MLGISCAVSPIPGHAFFQQPVFQHLFGKRLLEVAHLAAQILDLTEEAWRAVSPANLFLPASRNSFDQL
jgi:hypothetical protein